MPESGSFSAALMACGSRKFPQYEMDYTKLIFSQAEQHS
jgi:hypothetical protein